MLNSEKYAFISISSIFSFIFLFLNSLQIILIGFCVSDSRWNYIRIRAWNNYYLLFWTLLTANSTIIQ